MRPLVEIGIHAEPKTRMDKCDKHGQYESKCFINSIWSKCPLCNDEAKVLEKAEADKKERDAKLHAWQKKIGNAGIPERFQSRSLKTFIAETPSQKRALGFALAYADRFEDVLKTGRSAVFIGKPGTGKTHLSTSIGLRIMHRYNRTVLFTSVLRAVRRIKETWHKDRKETESEATAALVFPDLLILDEVGQQFGTDAEKLILFEVLNGRYEKRKPTLLLANIPLEDYKDEGQKKPGLKSFLGERIIDRLREDGGEFIVFDWESKRGKI